MSRATAVAHPNIALVKYWGKRDTDRNIPATGSLSMTLSGLETRTTVEFSTDRNGDFLQLDGDPVESGRALDRIESFLDLVRRRAGVRAGARVVTRNNFPTGAGLASSASGFAALATAATEALDLEIDDGELSALARRGSGSAARSLFGGFVRMETGSAADGSDARAHQLAEASHWDLRCFVVETVGGQKRVGSTEGMLHTERTSPYYDAWTEQVPGDLDRAEEAVVDRDFSQLWEVAEANCLRMHAAAMAADPGLIYWAPETVSVVQSLRAAQREGLEAFFTIDAGPHVKVFSPTDGEEEVAAWLGELEVPIEIHETTPGPGASLVGDHLEE
ncbi:MAG: diphosphomevalonate decarboxylase [Bradymonadaceae bacterium]